MPRVSLCPVIEALRNLAPKCRERDLRVGQAVVHAILTELGRDADLARLSYLEDQRLADILEKYAGG